MTAMVNVYQFNDFRQYDGNRQPFTEYYHAARIPAAELLDPDIVDIAEYLILSSYTSVWYGKKMRPMRAGDLVVLAGPRRQVVAAYILDHGGPLALPQFSSLTLDTYYLPQKEFEHDEKYDMAFPGYQ